MSRTAICIIAILVGICSALAWHIVRINQEHDERISYLRNKTNKEISDLLKKQTELSLTVCEYEKQIWNIIHKEEYEVSIHRDGALHTFKRDKNGIFGNTTHIITHIQFH